MWVARVVATQVAQNNNQYNVNNRNLSHKRSNGASRIVEKSKEYGADDPILPKWAKLQKHWYGIM